MYEDNKGRLWFRTLTGYIVNIDTYTYEIKTIEARVSEYYMNSMFMDEQEVIWAGTSSSNKYYKINPPYTTNDIEAITDSSSMLHIFTRPDNGFMYYRSRIYGENTVTIHRDQSDFTLHLPGINSVMKVMDLEPNIIITTGDQHWIINEENVATQFTTEQKISYATMDVSGNLWICLLGNAGVLFYPSADLSKPPVRYFSGIGISCVLQDHEGSYWFTSTTNGVFYAPSFVVLTYNFGLASLKKKTTGVYCQGDGSVVGKNYDGTYFNPKDETAIHPIVDGVMAIHNLRPINAHHNGKIVVQSIVSDEYHPASEVFRLKNKPGYWTAQGRSITHADENYVNTDRYVPNTRINSYCLQDSTTFWLACLDGLWSFSDEQFHSYAEENALLAMRFDDVQIAKEGTLWLCSRRCGVVVREGERVLNITVKNGLASDMCRAILLDGNIVWVGTNRGISKITWNGWDNYSIENITLQHGLPSAEISMIDKCGDVIWVASDAGLFSFNEHYEFTNDIAPPICVQQMLVNELSVDGTSHLHLKTNENFIRISLVCLSFKYPKANTFRYQLSGLDSVWTTTSNNEIVFTTLPPGTYTFTAYALNNSGVPSEMPVVIHFDIAPPFWLQWWFILLVIATFAAVVCLVVQKRIASIHRKAEEKTALAKNFAELEMRALRTQMNPHFIFNCINSIQHYILSNDKMEAQKQLTRFSKLIRNVLENSKQDLIPLQTEMETLELYIQMEALRFDSKFSYQLNISSGIDKVSTLVPPMIIQPFVENAIGHGLLPLKGRDGELTIELNKLNGFIQVVIDDNGIGRAKATLLKERKASQRKSLGISITQERLDILSKSSNSDSSFSISIQDKKDSNDVALGTTVEILIPIQKG